MTRSSTSPFFLLSLFLFKKQRGSKMIRSTSPFVLSSLLLLKKQTQQLLYMILLFVTMISVE